MQAIFFTSATVSQGTMLSLESKLAINCKNQKGSPVYLAALGLVDAAGPKHRERRLMEESHYFRVSPPVRTHEKKYILAIGGLDQFLLPSEYAKEHHSSLF